MFVVLGSGSRLSAADGKKRFTNRCKKQGFSGRRTFTSGRWRNTSVFETTNQLFVTFNSYFLNWKGNQSFVRLFGQNSKCASFCFRSLTVDSFSQIFDHFRLKCFGFWVVIQKLPEFAPIFWQSIKFVCQSISWSINGFFCCHNKHFAIKRQRSLGEVDRMLFWGNLSTLNLIHFRNYWNLGVRKS